MEILNARITGVTLTMADHGCLTFYIFVDACHLNGGIGGYCIGSGYLGAKEFSANGNGLEAMMNIMNVVGVSRWEDLQDKYCRVKYNSLGEGFQEIGNIIEDKWFNLKDFFKSKATE